MARQTLLTSKDIVRVSAFNLSEMGSHRGHRAQSWGMSNEWILWVLCDEQTVGSQGLDQGDQAHAIKVIQVTDGGGLVRVAAVK